MTRVRHVRDLARSLGCRVVKVRGSTRYRLIDTAGAFAEMALQEAEIALLDEMEDGSSDGILPPRDTWVRMNDPDLKL